MKNTTYRQKLADFFELMIGLSAIGSSTIQLTENTSKRSLFGKDVSFAKDEIEITMTRFFFEQIKHLSKDKSSEVLLSIPVKISKNEENTEFNNIPTVSPLVSFNISKYIDELELIFKKVNLYTLKVKYSDLPLILNEPMLTSEFFNFKDDFFTVDKDGKKYDVTLADLVPEDQRGTEEALVSFLSYFKPKSNALFNLSLSSTNKNKMLFILFEEKKFFKMKKNVQSIVKYPTEVLKQYLFGIDEKKVVKFSPSCGHYAKSFPMAPGQYDSSAIVDDMSNDKISRKILSVFGPAGTGKSAFIHSAMDTILISMVKELLAGKNVKLNAIVSTAYKAVTGLLSDYSSFMTGITYVGGNEEKNKISKVGNNKLIAELETSNHNPVKMHKLIKEVTEHEKKMDMYLSIFRQVKSEKVFVDFKNIHADLQTQLKFMTENTVSQKDISFYNEVYFSVLKIVGIDVDSLTLDEAIEKTVSVINNNRTKIKVAFDKSTSQGIMSSFFSRLVLELDSGEVISKEEDIFLLNHIEGTIDLTEMERVLTASSQEEKKDLFKTLVSMCKENNGKYIVSKMISEKDEVEFARIYLYKISNKIGHKSKLILRELALKNKAQVIRAIKVFSAPNAYEYLRTEYNSSVRDHDRFISSIAMVYPFIGSSLASILNVFPGLNEYVTPFNFVIADEAGMITSIDMVPVLQKSDKAIIVGDTKQLQPIFSLDEMFTNAVRSTVNDEEMWKAYSPTSMSAFHLAAGLRDSNEIGYGNSVLLNEHRRCAEKIINIAIDIVEEYRDLKVCTPKLKDKDLELYNKIGDNLMFVDVKKSADDNSKEKINWNEVNKIEEILNKLQALGFDLTKDIGLITPYKDQSKLLKKKFGERLGENLPDVEPRIGTVHAFQGAEYKVIIMSTVASSEKDSLNFINSGPYMVNVAVTRAKNHFFLVGDYDKLTSVKSGDNFIGRIAKKMKETGIFVKKSVIRS